MAYSATTPTLPFQVLTSTLMNQMIANDASFHDGTGLDTAVVTSAKMLGIDLLGRTSALFGSPPSAGTGQFYLQAGTTTGTFSANALDITYPTPFPNGTLTVLVSNGDVSADAQPMTLTPGTTSASGFRAQSYNGVQRVNWVAVGF